MLLSNGMTSVIAEKRAPTIVGKLTGKAPISAKALSLFIIASDFSLDRLIAKLNKKS